MLKKRECISMIVMFYLSNGQTIKPIVTPTITVLT